MFQAVSGNEQSTEIARIPLSIKFFFLKLLHVIISVRRIWKRGNAKDSYRSKMPRVVCIDCLDKVELYKGSSSAR